MIWFTADFHLGHANIIKYCKRPFATVDEMDKKILDNLAKLVHDGDTLYFLGDLSFKKERAFYFLKLLGNAKLVFIPGNHDSPEVLQVFADMGLLGRPLEDISIDGHSITLCHYAMRVWNASHYNSWQLYGHSHARLSPAGKQHDVGVDNNDFKPISMDQLIAIMRARPDNENFVRGKQDDF
ncbi:MAG: metallophosphoesterase [Candidatus Lokiarchaeota archaeon]|nr:metallophosphoesterase [Candidatus Lokiarchaeota archaeon]